ncbi:hypothetical protein D3C71_1868780 [compost metagenome]
MAPVGQGVSGGAHGLVGLVAVGACVLGHHLAGVRRVGADTGGGANLPATVDQVPGVLLRVAEFHEEDACLLCGGLGGKSMIDFDINLIVF